MTTARNLLLAAGCTAAPSTPAVHAGHDGTCRTVTVSRGVVASIAGDRLTVTERTRDATCCDAHLHRFADARHPPPRDP